MKKQFLNMPLAVVESASVHVESVVCETASCLTVTLRVAYFRFVSAIGVLVH